MAKKMTSKRNKLIAILAILGGLLAIYNLFSKEESEVEAPEVKELQSPIYPETPKETLSSKEVLPQQQVDLATLDYEHQAQPKTGKGVSDKKIEHKAYSLSYNKDFKVPNWVFYELTREEIEGRLERSNNFQPDPEIKREDAAQLEDYRHSGWDRGHMAPSMDMNWRADVLDESYFLSNMCPQGHDFNSGIWLDLEHEVRYWAKRDSAVCVVTGPVLPKSKKANYRRLPQSKVLIPDYFYKIVYAPFAKNGPRAIAFIMPNEQQSKTLGSFAVTIDSVEHLTGIDFFSILPDDLEDRVESQINKKDWLRKRDF